MNPIRSLVAAMRSALTPTPEERVVSRGTPGERHRYALKHFCASHPQAVVEDLSRWAYVAADAMLAERKRGGAS